MKTPKCHTCESLLKGWEIQSHVLNGIMCFKCWCRPTEEDPGKPIQVNTYAPNPYDDDDPEKQPGVREGQGKFWTGPCWEHVPGYEGDER